MGAHQCPGRDVVAINRSKNYKCDRSPTAANVAAYTAGIDKYLFFGDWFRGLTTDDVQRVDY